MIIKNILKCIHIDDDELEYYHIYFDNNKKEKKRNYLKENENIKAIKVIIDYNVISFEKLFMECEYIESIYFKKFYRNDIEDMSSMFARCSSLKELNLSNFKINNV